MVNKDDYYSVKIHSRRIGLLRSGCFSYTPCSIWRLPKVDLDSEKIQSGPKNLTTTELSTSRIKPCQWD